MEEYRIEMKVKNNLLFSKIEEYGYTSIFQFCKAHKIAYASLTNFINMRKSIFILMENYDLSLLNFVNY